MLKGVPFNSTASLRHGGINDKVTTATRVHVVRVRETFNIEIINAIPRPHSLVQSNQFKFVE